MSEGDIDAIRRSAVDGPRLTAKIRVIRQSDFSVATESPSDPAALAGGGGDDHLEAFGFAGRDQGMDEGRVDAIVIGEQGGGLHAFGPACHVRLVEQCGRLFLTFKGIAL